MSQKELSLHGPITAVLSKWVTNNSVASAVVNGTGAFADIIKEQVLQQRPVEARTHDADHSYVNQSISFEDFENEEYEADFNIQQFMKNFRPASADAERLFSFCRLSKTYLQNRLSVEWHCRNVFLNKNKAFFDL